MIFRLLQEDRMSVRSAPGELALVASLYVPDLMGFREFFRIPYVSHFSPVLPDGLFFFHGVSVVNRVFTGSGRGVTLPGGVSA
jgi:hypothetical protein